MKTNNNKQKLVITFNGYPDNNSPEEYIFDIPNDTKINDIEGALRIGEEESGSFCCGYLDDIISGTQRETEEKYIPQPKCFWKDDNELYDMGLTAYYNYLKKIICNKLKGKTISVIALLEDKSIPSEPLIISFERIKNGISEEIDNTDSDQSQIFAGIVIANSLEQFMEQGKWFIGLKRKSDDYIELDNKKWVDLSIWKNETSDWEPIVWFGLVKEVPNESWIITRDNEMSVLEYNNETIEIDWDALGVVDLASWWYLFEYGGYSPSPEEILKNCPITFNERIAKLKGNNSKVESIDEFFEKYQNLENQKREALKKAIRSAGYEYASGWIGDYSVDEDTVIVGDGRVNPCFLSDCFGEAASEILNCGIEDLVNLDKDLFPNIKDCNDFHNLIYTYLDWEDEESSFIRGIEDYISEAYGDDWKIKYDNWED